MLEDLEKASTDTVDFTGAELGD